jgi:hypothetical protein
MSTQRADESSLADRVAYWLAVASIYGAFGFLWYYSAYQKFVGDSAKMPDELKESFDGTLLDAFPGLDVSWFLLALLQAIAFVGIAASIVSREFMPSRRKPILLSTIGLSLAIFALLMFGANMTANHDTVQGLFTYFGTSVLVLVLVLLMPPYRPARWLSGLRDG